MSESEVIQQSKKAYTQNIIIDDLKKLSIKKGDNIMVHSSLSQLGWIVGAERTVLSALLEVIGEDGTIAMPCFSGDNSDPTLWQNPPIPEAWIEDFRLFLPPFDPLLTSTRQMGRIVDLFRHYPNVLRSSHPQVSFCALGPLSHSIIDNHQLSPSFGKDSPLQRMYDYDFKVLLLGVGYGNCTCMHLGEVWLENNHWIQTGSRIIENGLSIWKEYQDIDYDDSDFETIGHAYEQVNQVMIGKVAQGEARIVSMKSITDFAFEWIKDNRIE